MERGRDRKFADLYGSFSVKWLFGLFLFGATVKSKPRAAFRVSDAALLRPAWVHHRAFLTRSPRRLAGFPGRVAKKSAPADDVIEEELMQDPYVITVRKGHPLANKKEITRADIAGFNWILAPSLACASRRIAFENTFPGLGGLHPNVEAHSLPTITSILANSDRMAILTQSELEIARQQGQRLKGLNFGSIEPSTTIGVTIRKDWHPTDLQRIFLEFLRGQTMWQPITKSFSAPISSPLPAISMQRMRSV